VFISVTEKHWQRSRHFFTSSNHTMSTYSALLQVTTVRVDNPFRSISHECSKLGVTQEDALEAE